MGNQVMPVRCLLASIGHGWLHCIGHALSPNAPCRTLGDARIWNPEFMLKVALEWGIQVHGTYHWYLSSAICRLRLSSSFALVWSMKCERQSPINTHLLVTYWMFILYRDNLNNNHWSLGLVSFRHFSKRLTKGAWSVCTVNCLPNIVM